MTNERLEQIIKELAVFIKGTKYPHLTLSQVFGALQAELERTSPTASLIQPGE